MNEKQLERMCCKEAEARGWMAIKLVSPGRRGVPDRLFVGPGGYTVFIEFKAPGGRVRPEQQRMIRDLQKMRHTARIVDNFDVFMTIMRW